jgi:hypothetical protein
LAPQLGSISQIAGYDGCFAAETFDLPGGGFERVSRAAHEHEVRTGFGQSGCDPGTYSGPGSGDHRHTIIETEAWKADRVGHGWSCSACCRTVWRMGDGLPNAYGA